MSLTIKINSYIIISDKVEIISDILNYQRQLVFPDSVEVFLTGTNSAQISFPPESHGGLQYINRIFISDELVFISDRLVFIPDRLGNRSDNDSDDLDRSHEMCFPIILVSDIIRTWNRVSKQFQRLSDK